MGNVQSINNKMEVISAGCRANNHTIKERQKVLNTTETTLPQLVDRAVYIALLEH